MAFQTDSRHKADHGIQDDCSCQLPRPVRNQLLGKMSAIQQCPNEHCRHQSPNATGCPSDGNLRTPNHSSTHACKPGQYIDAKITRAAPQSSLNGPEYPQRIHVHKQMDLADMNEATSHQSPPLASDQQGAGDSTRALQWANAAEL